MDRGNFIYMIQCYPIIKVGMTTSPSSRMSSYITALDGDTNVLLVQVRCAHSSERRLLNWCRDIGYMRDTCGAPGYSREHVRRDLDPSQIQEIQQIMIGMSISQRNPIRCTLSNVRYELSQYEYEHAQITVDDLEYYTISVTSCDPSMWRDQWRHICVEYSSMKDRPIPLEGISSYYYLNRRCNHCNTNKPNREYQTVLWIPGHDSSIIEIGSSCIKGLFNMEHEISKPSPSIVDLPEMEIITYLMDIGVDPTQCNTLLESIRYMCDHDRVDALISLEACIDPILLKYDMDTILLMIRSLPIINRLPFLPEITREDILSVLGDRIEIVREKEVYVDRIIETKVEVYRDVLIRVPIDNIKEVYKPIVPPIDIMERDLPSLKRSIPLIHRYLSCYKHPELAPSPILVDEYLPYTLYLCYRGDRFSLQEPHMWRTDIHGWKHHGDPIHCMAKKSAFIHSDVNRYVHVDYISLFKEKMSNR